MTVETIRQYAVDLDKGVTRCIDLGAALLTGDQNAHTFCVACFRGEQAVDLSGASVTGYCIRQDGATVLIAGSCHAHTATLTLTDACYAVAGSLSLIVKLTMGKVISTILWGQGTVGPSRTDTLVDEEHTIPSLDELLAQIAAMEAATTAANTAAAKAEQVGSISAQATTLPAGSAATATLQNGVLALGIPQGAAGSQGPKGDTGPQGPKGEDGSVVSVSLESGIFAMHVDESGHLILTHCSNEPAPPISINEAGHMVYTID